MGNIQFWRGEFKKSRQYIEQSISIYEPQHHETLVTHYGENAYVTSSSYLAWTLCLLGLPEQALRAGEQAVAEARRVGHPFSLGYALMFLTVLHRMLRAPAVVLNLAEETIALAVYHDLPLWQVGATLNKGWAQVMLGDSEGLVDIQRSTDQVQSLMSGISLIFLETQADSLRQVGQYQQALTVIDHALTLVEKLDDHHVEAELYRLKGTCLLKLSLGSATEAENCFQRAFKVSRRQHSLLLELRTAMAMAQFWASQNKTAKAYKLLADVYSRFTEGFESPDLCRARKLLGMLDL